MKIPEIKAKIKRVFSKEEKEKVIGELQAEGKFEYKHYIRVIQKDPPVEICRSVDNGGLSIPLNENGILTLTGDKHDLVCKIGIDEPRKQLVLKLVDNNNDLKLDLDKEKTFDKNNFHKEIQPLTFIYVRIRPFIQK